VREKSLQTPRSVKKEGGRGSRCWSRDSPAAHGKDHGDAGCPPCNHWRTVVKQISMLHPMEDLMPEQVDVPQRKL